MNRIKQGTEQGTKRGTEQGTERLTRVERSGERSGKRSRERSVERTGEWRGGRSGGQHVEESGELRETWGRTARFFNIHHDPHPIYFHLPLYDYPRLIISCQKFSRYKLLNSFIVAIKVNII